MDDMGMAGNETLVEAWQQNQSDHIWKSRLCEVSVYLVVSFNILHWAIICVLIINVILTIHY